MQHPESTNPPIDIAPSQAAMYESQGWHKVASSPAKKSPAKKSPAKKSPASPNPAAPSQ